MNFGKTIEDTSSRTRRHYPLKRNFINETISSKFTEIGDQTALSRLRRVLCKLFKFCFIGDQLFHFTEVIKFINDDNAVTFVGFRYYDTVIVA